MHLSAGGLRRRVLQQVDVGAYVRLLVRLRPDVKVETAARGDSRPALAPWMASIAGREQ